MTHEKVTFEGAHGAKLAGRLEWPEGRPRAMALFAHCFTCSKDVFAASRIAAGLTEAGFAVLRFDFTGLGHSEGEFANTNFSSNVADLVAAADHLRRHHQAPMLLVGHSLGGAACLLAAGRIEECRAVATIGAPAEPSHVARLLGEGREKVEAEGEAEVEIAGRSFRIQRQFLKDLEQHNMAEHIANLKKPLLVMHAPFDNIVGIDNASEIFRAARHPKSFVSLDDADHLLSRRADAAYVASVIAAWAGRYVPLPEPGEEAAPAPEVVRVAETGEGRFAQTVSVGRHRLKADEPASMGGGDSGPAPYDYVAAGLGACTSMTLRLYAERKKWPLTRVSVDVRHDKVHAEDCADCETRKGRIDRFARIITIEGDLDDEQRRRLLEIADKCPVHRTLESEIKIRTRLADG